MCQHMCIPETDIEDGQNCPMLLKDSRNTKAKLTKLSNVIKGILESKWKIHATKLCYFRKLNLPFSIGLTKKKKTF